MGGIANLTPLINHLLQGLHISAEILDGAASFAAKNVVASEHGVLFLDDETHVIFRVARGMYCTDCGAFDLEDLAVRDWSLATSGVVLVDGVGEVRVQLQKLGYTKGVVTMPVS